MRPPKKQMLRVLLERADLIPGASELIHALKRRGYTLALVADGYPGTYRNVLTQHALYDCFDVFAISEEVGVNKPRRAHVYRRARSAGCAAGRICPYSDGRQSPGARYQRRQRTWE